MNPSQPTPNFNLPEPIDAAQTMSGELQAPAPVNTAAHSRASNAPQPEGMQQGSPTTQSVEFGDSLSPQWINAVEQAVRQGIEDPKTLSLQLDELRAQYIAGRFTKDIKRQQGQGK